MENLESQRCQKNIWVKDRNWNYLFQDNWQGENQQYKITQNDCLQYKSPDCISETVKEIKLILIRKQGVEYNL